MRTPLAHPQIAKVEELAQRLGERLRVARKRRGLAIDLLSKKIGRTAPTYHGLESGNLSVSLGTFLSVMVELGLGDEIQGLLDPERDVVGQAAEKRRKQRKKTEPMNNF